MANNYPPQEQSINIPQLLLVLVISGFAIRYFFFSSSQNPGGANGNGNAAAGDNTNRGQRGGVGSSRVREADVERLEQMFPQLDRRTVIWNLQRDGVGGVAGVVERMLNGRGLETPPNSFQPPLPPTSQSASGSTNSQRPTPTSTQPDLITRYNLSSKLKDSSSPSSSTDNTTNPSSSSTSTGSNSKVAWSSNPNERHNLLQKRREEMILQARKKMEAKVAAEKEKQRNSGSGS